MSLLLTTLLTDQQNGPLTYRVSGPRGGEEGTRTPTPFRARDPKSRSSANSDTSPNWTQACQPKRHRLLNRHAAEREGFEPSTPGGVRDFQSRALGQAMRPLQGTRA